MTPEIASPTRLVLVRHGRAVCNVERTVEGVAKCRGLCELGRQQGEALANRLRAEGFSPDVIVSSTIRRARQTAALVSAALGRSIDGFDADFEEVRPGDAEGMTWDQYFAFYGALEGWDPAVPFAPNGEAWIHFAARVSRSLDRIAATHIGKTVLVVAHGGVIDASLFHFFGLDPNIRAPIDFETANASITEWELRSFPVFVPNTASTPSTEIGGERSMNADPETPAIARWRLVRYNDAAHLHGIIEQESSIPI